jgi:transcriptional regulator with XRE-family HTH domain
VPRKRAHPGTVREVYARRLRGIRNRRGWTQQQLADALRALDFPLGRVAIAKIENGKRPMEVSELVALATALDVPPAALFLPLGEAAVALTKGRTVDFAAAAAWAADDGPLDPENARTYLLESPTFSARAHLEARAEMRTAGTVTPGKGADDHAR